MDTTLLRIETLGTFRLLQWTARSNGYEEIAINLSRTGPPLTFLKVLLATESQLNNYKISRHQASKDYVIDALWPEEDSIPKDIDNALSHAKSTLNRALRLFLSNQDLILRTEGSDRTGYQLNLPLVSIDADEFELLCTQAGEVEGRGGEDEALHLWELAWALVRGDFLPQDQYNEWSKERRERLAGRYRLCLHRLVTLYVKHNRIVEAIGKLHPYVLGYPEDIDLLFIFVSLLIQEDRSQEALQLLGICKEKLALDGSEREQELVAVEVHIRQLQKATRELRLDVPLQRGHEQRFSSIQEHSSVSLDGQQIAQMKQTAFSLNIDNSVFIFPSSMATVCSFPEMIPDCAARFSIKLAEMITFIQQWSGMAKFCHHLQDQLDQTIKGLDMLKLHSSLEVYTLSRRSFLITLAALPSSLLVSSRQAHKMKVDVEQFLPQCAASIIACWHLSGESHLDTISPIIDSYIPTLIAIVENVPFYREMTADLIAQCYFLKAILAWHLDGLHIAETYCAQAMRYSIIANNINLRLTALNQHALIAYYAKQFSKALAKSEEAQATLQHASHEYVFPIVQGRVYMYLAAIQAQQKQGTPEKTIEYAQEAFNRQAGVAEHVPLYADCGDAPLTLWDGLTHYHLSFHSRAHASSALTSLRIFGQLQASTKIPERFRLECLTNRTLAAIQCNELEEAIACFEGGRRGAKGLESRQRIAEVGYVYQSMCKQWPHEERIKIRERMSL